MHKKPLTASAIILVLATLACQFLPGSSGGGSGGNSSNSLFTDDFSGKSGGWDEVSNDNAATGYADNEYFIKVFPAGWFAWANPEGANLSLSNIHIEVTARSVGSATEAGFGVMCAYGNKGDDTYYMGDASSWKPSDSIPVNADSYRLGADCGNGKLALQINGATVGSVDDATFSSGTVGLFVQTFKDTNAEFRFDNYVVTALE
jgi:hypothetical protein